jgi:hypothetical protein
MPSARPVFAVALAVAVGMGLVATSAAAADMPTFSIEMKDGAISPARIKVPANRPFKLEIRNAGTTPAEFESLTLHKEKVLPADTASSMVFRRLEPGEYEFFDDFHPGSKMLLVAE